MSSTWIEKVRRPDGKIRGYKPRWREGTRKPAGPVFERRAEARSWLDTEIQPQLNARGYTKSPNTTTLVEWLDQYEKDVTANRLLSPAYREYTHYQVSTVKKLVEAQDAHRVTAQRLGPLPIHAIEGTHIAQLLRARQSEGVSARSVRAMRAVLSKAFSDAKTNGLCNSNPVIGLSLTATAPNDPTIIPMDCVDEEGTNRPGDDIPTLAVVDKTIELLHDISPVYGALGAIAAGAGLRYSEVLGLTPSRIRFGDPNLKKIVVERRLNEAGARFIDADGRFVLRAGTKSNKIVAGTVVQATREAIMIDRWSPIVSTFIHQLPSEERCFKTPKGANISRTNFSRDVWKKMMVKLTAWAQLTDAHIPDKYTLHTLRHYYASEMHALGVSPVEVARNLGHSKVSTTLDVYTHSRVGDQHITAATLRRVGQDAEVIAINKHTASGGQ